MIVVKPTFESLLKDVDEVFIRIDTYKGIIRLVAGGINPSGTWIEFASQLKPNTSLYDIARSLEIMVHFLEQEKKAWSMERPHHLIFKVLEVSVN